jgi:alpha-amylase
LTPVVVAQDGTIKVPAALTYKSGNTKVLTVNASGKFTAKKVKKKTKVIVTVNAANGTSKKLTVYVVPGASKVKRITVIGSPKTLKIGAIKQLTIKLNPASATNVKPTFRSSKSSVVSVDASGNMRALKKGTAVITVKVSGKTAKTKRITVR